jgi:hypothetical protein
LALFNGTQHVAEAVVRPTRDIFDVNADNQKSDGGTILAGVLPKLGGYSLLRVFPILVNFFRLGFVCVSIKLVGGSWLV